MWTMRDNLSVARASGCRYLCGGISYEDGEWSYDGVRTFYGGVRVTTPGVRAGYAYTCTWVSQLVTWPWA